MICVIQAGAQGPLPLTLDWDLEILRQQWATPGVWYWGCALLIFYRATPAIMGVGFLWFGVTSFCHLVFPFTDPALWVQKEQQCCSFCAIGGALTLYKTTHLPQQGAGTQGLQCCALNGILGGLICVLVG
ncbi:hypothetical protein BS47DRAFT_1360558 [Hydnum rufescens UP504]|uniref:Uncharacterized protein n=1 Tax=Hydnum rufescens UP504 TaxID=1448309 RepID=A0A9P6B2G7_9AGAM|nr:hypothetical protein BS47DRAFT_1360558 [Hydnum rufescens UP504]